MPHPHALIDFANPRQPAGTAVPLAFGEPDQVLVAHTVHEVAAVLAQVDALSRQGRWCVGYVRYEAAPAFDAALQVHTADGPLVWFGVHTQPLPEYSADYRPEPTVHWHAGVDRAVFDQNMAEIHRAIAAGSTECGLLRFQQHDVAVSPLGQAHTDALLEHHLPGVRIVNFGHLGDGNLHYNVQAPAGQASADFLRAHEAEVNALVYDAVVQFGGTFSAEHGVGRLKVAQLQHYSDPVALQLMHT